MRCEATHSTLLLVPSAVRVCREEKVRSCPAFLVNPASPTSDHVLNTSEIHTVVHTTPPTMCGNLAHTFFPHHTHPRHSQDAGIHRCNYACVIEASQARDHIACIPTLWKQRLLFLFPLNIPPPPSPSHPLTEGCT